MMRARFLRPAEAEANEAIAYLDEQRPGLGDRLEEDLRATIEFITQHPHAAKSLGGAIRQTRLRTFRYNIVYAVDANEIIIVAIAHQRRRPGYWHDRLKSAR